jgi:hypothetical protein
LDTEVLLDQQTKNLLQSIRTEHPNGEALAKQITGKLLVIKKRFVHTIVGLVDESFFNRSESTQPYGRFTQDSFDRTVGAAYDLRSKYVHTGDPFGPWISMRISGADVEVPIAQPVMANKELAKVLAKAPTLIGLERIIRYCLLRFAENNGGYVHSVLGETADG